MVVRGIVLKDVAVEDISGNPPVKELSREFILKLFLFLIWTWFLQATLSG